MDPEDRMIFAFLSIRDYDVKAAFATTVLGTVGKENQKNKIRQ